MRTAITSNFNPAIERDFRTCGFRAAIVAGIAFLLAAISPAALAQDSSLDVPFSSPQYLIHLTGTSTMDGLVAKDVYMLINEAPQNGVWVSPDGMGGSFSNTADLIGGPFYTPRDVCAAAQGLPTQSFTSYGGNVSFNCAPPPPPPTVEQPTEQVPSNDVQEAPSPAPLSSTRNDWDRQFSDWWDSSSIGEKVGAGLAALGILALLNAIWTWLFANTLTYTGKMSTFGGPDDKVMKADEDLAIMDRSDLTKFSELFLAEQPKGTTGLGRRLNPNAAYVACRWDYSKTPKSHLKSILVTVTNPANGQSIQARPVDWGPNDGTGRIIDLSPSVARVLGLSTDQTCTLTVPLPKQK